MADCIIESCDRPARRGGRGWCHAHYMRWYQTGDVRAGVPLRPRGGDPELRFWPKVDKRGPIPAHRPELGPCWVWTGNTDRNGYGLFRANGLNVGAHRFAYETTGQSIPADLEIDHLCKNRACVNAMGHLEPVTHEENMRRAFAHQTHCSRGHEFTEDNIQRTKTGGRTCRKCANRRVAEFHQRRSESDSAPCSVAECSRVAKTRGWCGTHYARWIRTGDPLATRKRGSWLGESCSVTDCDQPVDSRGWCKHHYQKWYATGDALTPGKQARPGTPLRERIESRISRKGDCWLWLGKIQADGYGRLNVNGAGRTPHRVAYEVYIGPIPDGLQVDQSCGNRACVSPQHLFATKQVTIAKRP